MGAVEDALTGIAYHDDSQIVVETLSKRFTKPGEEPGVTVTVTDRLARIDSVSSPRRKLQLRYRHSDSYAAFTHARHRKSGAALACSRTSR